MNREPSVTLGIITAAVASTLALLTAFGVNFTPDQQIAILGIIAGIGPLVAAIAIRFKVFAPANVSVVFGPTGLLAGPAALGNVKEGTPVTVSPLEPAAAGEDPVVPE